MVNAAQRLSSLEICAGAGGMALGLEQAGFDPVTLIEKKSEACSTLRANRPKWHVVNRDLLKIDPPKDLPLVDDLDLLSAGLPRVRSAATASRTRGDNIELELLETTGRWISELRPRAVVLENVPDLVSREGYAESRSYVEKYLDAAGYEFNWRVVNACNFGVPQQRQLGILVAFRDGGLSRFDDALATIVPSPNLTVGAVLRTSIAARGWLQADEWAAYANRLAPTIVGGSWERGGADLGPAGSQRAWARLGVEGKSLWDTPPAVDFRWDPDIPEGRVRLTVDQIAELQAFPSHWEICGGKTARYRQIGNATPPPAAQALGRAVRAGLNC
ncbi:DNA cytosine methyltransferase [Nocardia vermiculata]|uniref:DNA (cytosine-5-)-methyltransferase n=1 Tax=Nocardia vermiculata TaxID=257274 RepID=A0A846XXX6_9NOCA|nr:DNA cytosine methyltransferase [Nocardia vermiculata]NKY52036.1 DNA cytosine methyltransferase [Nocardia vermiculata]